MANKFSVDATRSDIFFIDPTDIVADEAGNGRFTEHAADDVESMAEDFVARGQLQPVIVRRDHLNRPVLVAGFRRWRAAKRYNDAHPATPMKLMSRLVTMNEEEAFLANLAENRERKETSPIDDAHNARALERRFGWGEEKVAAFYRKSVSHVQRLMRLLTLPHDVQLQVHRGDLTVSAAEALTHLAPAEAREVLAEATTTPAPTKAPKAGKEKKKAATLETIDLGIDAGEGEAQPPAPVVDSAAVRAKVAAKRRKRGERQARGVKEIKAILARLQEVTESGRAKEVADVLLAAIAGEHADEEVVGLLNSLLA